MTLTQDDLQAIQQIVQTTVKTVVQPIVDEAVDGLAQSTAAGFEDVYKKIDAVESRLEEVNKNLSRKIDNLSDKLYIKGSKLEDTILRVDNLEAQFPNFKPRMA